MTTNTAKIKVNTSESFRQKLAVKMVEQSDPAYDDQGRYYADIVSGIVYFAKSDRAWNPWFDDNVVPIDKCFDTTANDFDPSIDWDLIDWNLVELPYRNMVTSYLEGEEFEEDDDFCEWVDRFEVIEFCRDSEAFGELITEYEAKAYQEAVSFAKSEILDEIEVESNAY